MPRRSRAGRRRVEAQRRGAADAAGSGEGGTALTLRYLAFGQWKLSVWLRNGLVLLERGTMKGAIVWLPVIVLPIFSCSVVSKANIRGMPHVSFSREPRSSRAPAPTRTHTSAANRVSRQQAELRDSRPERPTLTPTPQRPIAAVKYNLAIRGGPGASYPVIGTASPGQRFPITGRDSTGEWWRIRHYGDEGWVYHESVTAKNGEGVQVVTITPSPLSGSTSTP